LHALAEVSSKPTDGRARHAITTAHTEMPEESYKRKSICVGCPEADVVIHEGHASFRPALKSLYVADESLAIEQLINLKSALQACTDSTDFYNILSQGLISILDAQFVFVSKRIVEDGEKLAIEMPPIGEPGSCLMGLLFYYNDGHGIKGDKRDVTYHAYECPCAYMKHEKIFLVPERLNDFFSKNPNTLPFPCDAYLGIPLFFQGKCIAHFGLMWSPEGNASRKLGWGMIELICHALEDLILRQVVKSSDYGTIHAEVDVVPHYAVDASQSSLKTYARCLSHELRTPMHGVVGMLDVMYATVQEVVESDGKPADKQLFQTLKDNIELVQGKQYLAPTETVTDPFQLVQDALWKLWIMWYKPMILEWAAPKHLNSTHMVFEKPV